MKVHCWKNRSRSCQSSLLQRQNIVILLGSATPKTTQMSPLGCFVSNVIHKLVRSYANESSAKCKETGWIKGECEDTEPEKTNCLVKNSFGNCKLVSVLYNGNIAPNISRQLPLLISLQVYVQMASQGVTVAAISVRWYARRCFARDQRADSREPWTVFSPCTPLRVYWGRPPCNRATCEGRTQTCRRTSDREPESIEHRLNCFSLWQSVKCMPML